MKYVLIMCFLAAGCGNRLNHVIYDDELYKNDKKEEKISILESQKEFYRRNYNNCIDFVKENGSVYREDLPEYLEE